MRLVPRLFRRFPLPPPNITQVQVLREFLSEYEHEASGGGGGVHGTNTAGGLGGSRGGSNSGMGLGDGSAPDGDDDFDERGLDEDNGGTGIGGGGGGSGGGSVADKSSHGRDWMRHELCGKLVSNLFSSKTLRERLSKKPVAGILVGLLCGPPTRWITGKTNSAGGSSSSSVSDFVRLFAIGGSSHIRSHGQQNRMCEKFVGMGDY